MTTNEAIETGAERETASVEAEPRESADAAGVPGHGASQRVVPVAEAKKYRKRAQSAEQSLEDVQRELQEKSQRVTELERAVADLERRGSIDQMLIEADAVDLESARLLTEAAVQQMDEPDVAEAVAELRRAKPFLFRASANGARTMSARLDGASGADDVLDHAAAEAHATGDRNDLLRYLRLRRKRSSR